MRPVHDKLKSFVASVMFKLELVQRGTYRKLQVSGNYEILGKQNSLLGVSNGLCEHLRACEHCVYFCEHEQGSIFASSEHFVNFSPARISLY